MKLPIRSFLCATPGKILLAFDFAQAESWVVAHLSNCTEMKDALKNGDIHTKTTRALYDIPEDNPVTKEQRYMGKKFNHAFNYGTSPQMIAHMVNVESINPPYISLTIAQAKVLHNKVKQLYFEVPQWWLEIQRELSQSRRLKTPYGRERTFYGQWGDSLFKEAYAYIPQSTVADHCLGATQPELGIQGGIREIYRRVVKSNKDISLLNTSHDSLILECPVGLENEIAPQVFNLLRRPLIVNGEEFTIPVDAEIGDRWGEMEKLEL
jgi:DNA polymerase I-like protein with 3'-5' exonuclease and polymerase domains